jgi:DNA excision repair protein ERCC-4
MSSSLLEYEADLFKEMFQSESALLIMAEGLGIERIFLNFLKLYSDSSQLVLVLNTHEAEEDFFIEKLKEENCPLSVYGKEIVSSSSSSEMPTTSTTSTSDNDEDKISIQLPTRITNETHTVAERVETYLKGGCFFVTSRILVVDMLTDRVPFDLVSGILVYNAHRVIDSCQETFILRMFRQKNKVNVVLYKA